VHDLEKLKQIRKTFYDIVCFLLLGSIVLSFLTIVSEVAVHIHGLKIPLLIISTMIALNCIILSTSFILITMVNLKRFIEWRNKGYN